MKNTKRYLAFLAVTALQGYGTGRLLRDAMDSKDSNAILGAAIITTVGFAANCYAGHKISEDMAIEVVDKIEELQEKRRQRKIEKATEVLEEA